MATKVCLSRLSTRANVLVNPQPQHGSVRQFVAHEQQKTENVAQPDGSLQTVHMLESLVFEVR